MLRNNCQKNDFVPLNCNINYNLSSILAFSCHSSETFGSTHKKIKATNIQNGNASLLSCSPLLPFVVLFIVFLMVVCMFYRIGLSVWATAT